ncbi:MAG: hypothetical protein J0L93_08815 [Deltaproteobacteria bacterium]|nr:hypothetical protein [Deltaproteobacteria bacterium]
MKRFLFILTYTAFFASCQSSSVSSLSEYQLIHPELSLGEYLQVKNSSELITVNRSSSQGGLVKISLPSGEITVLDASASEARDIKISEDQVAYRVGQELRLLSQTNGHTYTVLSQKISKLRSFDKDLLCFENEKSQPKWMRIDSQGRPTSSGELPGSVKATAVLNDVLYLAYQNDDGFFFAQFPQNSSEVKDSLLIEATGEDENVGSYAAMRFFGSEVIIGYLAENTGQFKIARKKSTQDQFHTEVIDGIANKNFRGMDIAIFNDRGKPGFLYLDAWEYKLRWARQQNGKWISHQLPIQGAVGFYNQIIQENSDEILIGFHNFRSQRGDETTYLNLATGKLAL